jgi:hypothetical protein
MAVALICGVVPVVLDRLFGPGAFQVAVVPAIPVSALALIVAVLGWRWSRTVAPPTVEQVYLPHGRFAVAALFIAAIAFGMPRLSHVFVDPPQASNERAVQIALPAEGH